VGEVVGTVNHNVVRLDTLQGIVAREPRFMQNHFPFELIRWMLFLADSTFGWPTSCLREPLALQVR
jgi:hypothetical protein